jgi:hypothetical protein
MTHPDRAPTTAGHLPEARGWFLDCGFNDELVDELTDQQIVRFVDSEYDGGWAAFLLATNGLDLLSNAPSSHDTEPNHNTSSTRTPR